MAADMNFGILFHSNEVHGSFFPGQIFHGFVSTRLTSETKIASIMVGCLGYGEIFNPPKNNEGEVQIRREMYVDELNEIYNFEKANWNEDPPTEVPKIRSAGNHLFPFTCVLPKNIPSSFESPQGYVRYSLTAYIEGPEYELVTVKKMFTVNAVFDLNNERKAKLPSIVWINEEPLLCCLGGIRMRAQVNIQRKGYVPGERIIINAEIGNGSRHPVQMVKATLVQVIKYNHKGGPKKIKRNVAEVLRGSISGHENQVWRDEPLLIPPVPATTLAHCSLIDIWYKLYFFVCSTGAEKGLTLKLPLLIGTIPLKQHLELFEYTVGDNHPLPDENLPYPTFEPCIFGPYPIGQSGERERQVTSYSPMYASYAVLGEDADL